MPNNNLLDKRNTNNQIYINGSFYHRSEAKISVFDSGFLLGDGIWEGLRLVNNQWLFIDEHIDRLIEGCLAIDITLNISRNQIKPDLAIISFLYFLKTHQYKSKIQSKGNCLA